MDTKPKQLAVLTRWMCRPDLPGVVDVEMDCEGRLNCQDILALLTERNQIAHVTENRVTGEIIGWQAYSLTSSTIDLLRFGVKKDWRRQGVATDMLRRLKERMSHARRSRLISYVDERSLDLQLFLSHRGFVARNVIGATYLMEYRHGRTATNVGTIEAQR